MSTQIIHTLREAAGEIRSLRRRNEILAAQVAVVEVFAAATGLKRENGGMSPDIAYFLEDLAKTEEAKLKSETQES